MLIIEYLIKPNLKKKYLTKIKTQIINVKCQNFFISLLEI